MFEPLRSRDVPAKAPALKDEVVKVYGLTWKIREAQSMNDALNSIAFAAATGSVGSREERDRGGVRTVLADVVRLNDDGTEMRATYQKGC